MISSAWAVSKDLGLSPENFPSFFVPPVPLSFPLVYLGDDTEAATKVFGSHFSRVETVHFDGTALRLHQSKEGEKEGGLSSTSTVGEGDKKGVGWR